MNKFIKQLSFIFAVGILFVSGSAFAACDATLKNLYATKVTNTSYKLTVQYDSGTSFSIKPQILFDSMDSFSSPDATLYPDPAQSFSGKNLLEQVVTVSPGKTYYFKSVATTLNCGVISDSNIISFTVPNQVSGAASVSTLTVDQSSAGVTAKGTFIPSGNGPVDVYFKYGKSGTYNNSSAIQRINVTSYSPNQITSIPFSEKIDVSMFSPGDTIYFKAVAGSLTDSSSIYITLPKPQTTIYQCNDGVDNDADGYTDYPADPACTSLTDDDESPKNTPTQVILGCTDNTASNYNSLATKDDGSCVYNGGSGIVYGCTDVHANNFNPHATRNNTPNSCVYGTGGGQSGCTDPKALNYNPSAIYSDGSCVYQNNYVYGCTLTNALNYNPKATINDGTCIFPGGGTGGGGTGQSGKPTAVTLIAKSATKTTATLAGIVYAPNTTANVYFEIFDANNVLLRSTPGQNLSIVGQSYYSFVATDLTANSIYYYRLVASNNLGTSVGDKMFVQTQKTGSTKTTTRSGPVAPIVKGTTVTNTATSTLGASAVFGNGFFPTSFIGWLILLIIILFIIVIARVFFKKKQ